MNKCSKSQITPDTLGLFNNNIEIRTLLAETPWNPLTAMSTGEQSLWSLDVK